MRARAQDDSDANADSVTVLIVGAGPTGLVLAIDLARRGIAVRIVEKAEVPPSASRGKGLQPRTLEIFDDLGVADAIVAGGGAFPRWRSYDGDRLLWEKSVYELLGRSELRPTIDRPYAETWMIPQWRTEKILRGRLASFGIEVEAGVEFTALHQDAGGVTASLRSRAGETRLRCRYLIGTDGARSQVRKTLRVPFVSETIENELYLIADLRAAALETSHWLNWSIGGDKVRRVSMCPLPQSDYFQFVAPLAVEEPPPQLSLSTAQRLFDQRTGRNDVVLSDARWMGLHRPNIRLAGRFRVGAVFLAGDAAHSPPPNSPGQGLNISIQDAYNLGWKLAAVLAGAPDGLLDSYEEERRPIAAALLGVLPRDLAAESADPRARAEAEARQTQIRRDVFNLDHSYRGSRLSRERRAAPPTVQAGDRGPDALIQSPSGGSMRVFDLLRGPQATVLAFGETARQAALSRSLAAAIDIQVQAVPPLAEGAPGSDPRPNVRQIYGVPEHGDALVFIRPDGYLALAADRDFQAELGHAVAIYQRV